MILYKYLKKRLTAYGIIRNRDFIPCDELEGLLGGVQHLHLVINGDLVVQKNVDTGMGNNHNNQVV